MHTFTRADKAPTHRLKSDHSVTGVLRELPARAKTNRPVEEADYEVIPSMLPDAPGWKVKVWMVRNGIDPDTIPTVIENSIPAGPERSEALIRWREVPTVPFNHPLVALVAAGLDLDPAAVWDQILAI